MILLDLWRRLFRRKRKRSFVTTDVGFIPEVWSRETRRQVDDAIKANRRAYESFLAAKKRD